MISLKQSEHSAANHDVKKHDSNLDFAVNASSEAVDMGVVRFLSLL